MAGWRSRSKRGASSGSIATAKAIPAIWRPGRGAAPTLGVFYKNRENNPMQSRVEPGSQQPCCAASGARKKNAPSSRPHLISSRSSGTLTHPSPLSLDRAAGEVRMGGGYLQPPRPLRRPCFGRRIARLDVLKRACPAKAGHAVSTSLVKDAVRTVGALSSSSRPLQTKRKSLELRWAKVVF
jgi:hypothetical protein